MSLLEDWEEETTSSSGFTNHEGGGGGGADEQVLEGYVALRKQEEDTPIFALSKVDYKPNGLVHMVVSSDLLVMALANCHIIRLNLKNPEELEDIEISRRPEDRIHKLFLDPSGSHLIISLESEENYYLNVKWKKPKVMSKMKGIVVSAVAWNGEGTTHTTSREILIGTNKGRIFETIIEANEKAFMERLVGGKEQVFKPVYNIGINMPITGLRMEKFVGQERKFFVMATTATRIYQFIGGPSFEVLFAGYETNPGFHELPGEISHSELQFFSKYMGLPKSFAWLTGPGVYHGDLLFGSQNPGDPVMVDTSLLPYPQTRANELPISLVLTEFHFLFLYSDRIIAISTLNNQVVSDDPFPKNQRIGRVRGMTRDAVARTIWLFAEFAVYEVVVTKEDRNVWQMYLDKGQYESALQYCKNPAQKDKVWTSQADHYFNNNNYKLAAPYYGKTQKSFEEITLKFINIAENDALKTYLLSKLETIKHTRGNRDATQMTAIGTWLTEIYLDKLNELRDSNSASYEVLKDEFEGFLKDYEDNLDKSTTFNLISSHGRIEELLVYASIIGDSERVISYHIQNKNWLKALDVMSKQNNEEIYYKFSPTLMNYIPYETVNSWIRTNPSDPRKLIPSLMRYNPENNPKDQKNVNQAIRYLETCVRQGENKEPAIHNFLLSLYATEKDEAPLLKFLSQPETHYDLKYALRLCTKENKTTACVLIYSAMGLYEEAVELALRVDLELAKVNAEKPDDDDALRKKLWLRIARYVVSELKDIKQAMELLNQCELLKIEDILPFFPEFTRIDDFKEEICSSLEDYNRHIEELKIEMEEATRSADLIRMDIKELRNNYGFVGAHRQCDLCAYPVLTREFYLFPCGHTFHAGCLKNDMMKHLDNVQRSQVNELVKSIQRLGQESAPKKKATLSGSATEEKESLNLSVSKIDVLKDELEDLIASECVLCGDVMIRSIAEPFVNAGDSADISGWAV